MYIAPYTWTSLNNNIFPWHLLGVPQSAHTLLPGILRIACTALGSWLVCKKLKKRQIYMHMYNYYIRSHYQMIGGILGSIWGVQIFCHEKVQNNMWCSSFFITDGCNSTLQIQKMDFFKETILVRPLKLAIFLSTDDNNDITEDLYMISFWN